MNVYDYHSVLTFSPFLYIYFQLLVNCLYCIVNLLSLSPSPTKVNNSGSTVYAGLSSFELKNGRDLGFVYLLSSGSTCRSFVDILESGGTNPS